LTKGKRGFQVAAVEAAAEERRRQWDVPADGLGARRQPRSTRGCRHRYRT